ncbi:MAG: nucleoside triphosphate pyrophosphohydrolase, partial [Bacteroidetes bacterium]|nr:nucleoside triphosphate pyrophosphohydrolase [Bacteroidota bacterium]
RFVDINPENALARTNQKFINRFTEMEKLVSEDSKQLGDMNLVEMDVYWEKAKLNLNKTV